MASLPSVLVFGQDRQLIETRRWALQRAPGALKPPPECRRLLLRASQAGRPPQPCQWVPARTPEAREPLPERADLRNPSAIR